MTELQLMYSPYLLPGKLHAAIECPACCEYIWVLIPRPCCGDGFWVSEELGWHCSFAHPFLVSFVSAMFALRHSVHSQVRSIYFVCLRILFCLRLALLHGSLNPLSFRSLGVCSGNRLSPGIPILVIGGAGMCAG